jgi:hypothetical protein
MGKTLPGNSVDQPYLIRSYEHELPGSGVCWWRPNSLGYTNDIEQAGLYTEKEAREIERRANAHGSVNEKAVPVGAAWAEEPLKASDVTAKGDKP